jgi:ABC-2 type transport system permease protein
MIAAILRAQWLSMRLGGRRGRIFNVLTGVTWYAIWTALAYGAFRVVSRSPLDSLRYTLPLALLGVCIYWQAMPILSASMGSALDLRKLLAYPIPHRKLFLVEVLLRVTTGAEMLLVLLGGLAGLFRNPATSGWTAVIPVLIFVLFNVLLASGARSLLERLLSKRKIRELLVFLIFMLWMVPRFFFVTGYRPSWLAQWSHAIENAAWPWTATAWVSLGQAGWYPLLLLVCWTLLAGCFGQLQFERNLRFDAVAARSAPYSNGASRMNSLADAFYRFPSALFRDPLAAIIEKEIRSLSRTPRYRMVFVMGFSFGLMVWLPMILGGRGASHSQLSAHFLTVVCVYALTLLGQVSYWNCFGFDRSATQIYFVSPQPLSRTLLGKNLASVVFIYLEVLILAGVTALFRVSFGLSQLVETLIVIGICSLYMLGMGNITSVQYPRALNPERVSQGGASSRFQALVFLLYPVSLLPVLLAYLARYALQSEVIFYLVLAVAALIGAAIYWIAMESAVSAAIERRESIIQALSTSDGPIAAD